MLHEAHVSLFRMRQRRAAYKAEWARKAYSDASSARTIRRRQVVRDSNARRRRGPRTSEYAAIKAKQQSLREYLNQVKDRPCADCGGSFPPYVMDFDHVRGKKLYAPGRVNIGRVKMEAEIAKCDVVCANCHRIRTHRQRLMNAFGSQRTE